MVRMQVHQSTPAVACQPECVTMTTSHSQGEQEVLYILYPERQEDR
jgi:hypothetical protein